MGITLDVSTRAALDQKGVSLGPAQVTAVASDGTIRAARAEEPAAEITVILALASPYRPQAGDSLLVIGQAGAWYAIGVLSGSGITRIAVPGDLEIAAPNGRLELSAGHAVRLTAPRIDAVARRLQLAADRLIERCQHASSRITGLLDVRAGRSRLAAADSHQVTAPTVQMTAAERIGLDRQRVDRG